MGYPAIGPEFLLLGGTGFLGRRLFGRLGAERTLTTGFSSSDDGSLRYDALSMSIDAIPASLRTIRYAIILFAEPRIDCCASDPEGSSALNVDATRRVIDQVLDRGITPVFTSSDMVFDGRKGNYCEDETATPIVTYGKQKLEIEQYLEKTGARYLAVRLAKVISGTLGYGGVLAEWRDTIAAERPIFCADDHRCSFIDVEDVVTGIIRLARSGEKGLFHCGGPEGLSRLELFELFVDCLSSDQRAVALSLMRRGSINDIVDLQELRPRDISINSDKLYRTIDFMPRRMKEICQEAVGHRDR